MELKVTKELLKNLKRENLTLISWVFLLSLTQEQEELFDLENVDDYAFVAQHLGVLGLIELCSDDSDNLYCLTEEGIKTIEKLKL